MAARARDVAQRVTGVRRSWRDVRVLRGCSSWRCWPSWSPWSSCWLYGNVTAQQRPARHPDRLRASSTTRRSSRSPAATSARPSRCATRSCEGLGNTLRLVVVGIVLATVLGTLVGIARLSGNWLVRTTAAVYVETSATSRSADRRLLLHRRGARHLPAHRRGVGRRSDVAGLSNRGVARAVARRRDWRWSSLVAVVAASCWRGGRCAGAAR